MEISDNQVRAILLLGLALMMPIGAYFRFSSFTDERLDRRQEGWPILISLRAFALLSTAGLIAYLVNPASMAWAAVPLPGLLRWIGLPLGAAACALAFWTFRTLGHNLTDTVVTRRDATLITHGPYHYIRHPFYAAFALALSATALLTANTLITLPAALAFAVIILRTPIEERKLVERFGQDYRDYMKRTGRFLPRM